MMKCPQCGSTRRISHIHEGDEVCPRCGCVLQESTICEEYSVRVFADDPASADRVHHSRPMSTFEIEEPMTDNDKGEPEKEFLMNGRKDINRGMEIVFPDSRPSGVLYRARELFDKSFVYQRDQKEGKKDFEGGKKRQNFSRRKAFVVSALYIGIMEQKISIPKPLLQLNHAIEGKFVSELSMKRCLREFGLPPSYLSEIETKCYNAQPKFLFPKRQQRQQHHKPHALPLPPRASQCSSTTTYVAGMECSPPQQYSPQPKQEQQLQHLQPFPQPHPQQPSFVDYPSVWR